MFPDDKSRVSLHNHVVGGDPPYPLKSVRCRGITHNVPPLSPLTGVATPRRMVTSKMGRGEEGW